jgi:hypothetical protein
MFIKFKDGDIVRRINTDNIIEVEEWPATEDHPYFDEEYGEERIARAQPTRVEVVTTGIDSQYDDGGDYYSPHMDTWAYRLTLLGQSAEDFIEQLDAAMAFEEA